ncbi:aspartate/glutamate racemase family protein [Syntrophobacter fumaroxidans]|uniref:Asp/Glu racemase n=1 Tax=Syntrophobacter fumaroxidans (strain DSM 10017 / MPOB) TaxID=335543 RepID=A0LP99_SYNFM|nr:aspartate/glutamate racemase family protein [Syntrophobacter fumaroxidans]ABK19251.1 Asp/Glu racemase [Syntrophobacter fumaroxidans MPOB]
MIRNIAFLHTVPFLVEPFSSLVAENLSGVACFHVVDEGILREVFRDGVLAPKVLRRILEHSVLAAQAGAELIVFTCSSTSPAVDCIRPLTDVPILKVDEPMAETAVRLGSKIGVVATVRTTLEPSAALVKSEAERQGKTVEVDARLEAEAFQARLSGNVSEHDRIIRQACADLAARNDVVVLAQASMAHLAESLQSELKRPVLSSPPLCMEALKKLVGDRQS